MYNVLMVRVLKNIFFVLWNTSIVVFACVLLYSTKLDPFKITREGELTNKVATWSFYSGIIFFLIYLSLSFYLYLDTKEKADREKIITSTIRHLIIPFTILFLGGVAILFSSNMVSKQREIDSLNNQLELLRTDILNRDIVIPTSSASSGIAQPTQQPIQQPIQQPAEQQKKERFVCTSPSGYVFYTESLEECNKKVEEIKEDIREVGENWDKVNDCIFDNTIANECLEACSNTRSDDIEACSLAYYGPNALIVYSPELYEECNSQSNTEYQDCMDKCLEEDKKRNEECGK